MTCAFPNNYLQLHLNYLYFALWLRKMVQAKKVCMLKESRERIMEAVRPGIDVIEAAKEGSNH